MVYSFKVNSLDSICSGSHMDRSSGIILLDLAEFAHGHSMFIMIGGIVVFGHYRSPNKTQNGCQVFLQSN